MIESIQLGFTTMGDRAVYQVTARVMNALNSHGARGNVYQLLEKYGARYSEAEFMVSSPNVRWSTDNMSVVKLSVTSS